MSRPRFVQFGAGNIGRGFTGQLFSDAGYELVFIDVRPEIVAALNQRGSYRLRFAGPTRFEERDVGPTRAVDGRDTEAVARELAEADLACTAVGVNALYHLAPTIALGIRHRAARGNSAPLDVLVCENDLDAASVFGMQVSVLLTGDEAKLISRVGFIQTVVSRMVPVLTPEETAADPLLVVVEDYDRLYAAADYFRGPIQRVPGLQATRRIHSLAEQKLYTHNMGHAVAAYLGFEAGFTYIHEAIADTQIAECVRGAMREAGAGLTRQRDITAQEQANYAEGLMARFGNAALRDTVARVGRDPLRKLRRGDRLVGAGVLALEAGVEPRNIALGIAAALRFDAPDDPSAGELQQRLAESGVEGILRDVSGLEPEHPLMLLVVEAYS